MDETKLVDNFKTDKFLFEGFKPPIRYDRDKNGGGTLIYIGEGVRAKELKIYSLPENL